MSLVTRQLYEGSIHLCHCTSLRYLHTLFGISEMELVLLIIYNIYNLYLYVYFYKLYFYFINYITNNDIAGHSCSSTPVLATNVFMTLTLCTGVLPCQNGFGPLVPVNRICNATAYKDTLDNCVLPTLLQQSEEEPHIGGMVRMVAYTFGHMK